MVKTCILCKKESTFLNAGRSFHKFPRDQRLKQDWMNATGLKVVTKTAVICSDHFDEDAFHYTGGHRKVQRLLVNAVPRKQTQLAFYVQSIRHAEDTIAESSNIESGNTLLSSAVPQNQTQSANDQSIKYTENTIAESSNTESGNRLLLNAVPQNQIQLTNVQSITPAEYIITESLKIESEDILASTSSHHCSDDETAVTAGDSMKRNPSVVNEQPAKKKVRFMTGFRTEYIERKDFVSDEAWKRFLRFNKYKTLKLRAANTRNFRKENKISIIAALLNDL